jgi:hypothetical protein
MQLFNNENSYETDTVVNFEVPMVMTVKSRPTIFWSVTSCSLVVIYLFLLLSRVPVIHWRWRQYVLQNVCTILPDHTTSYPIGEYSEADECMLFAFNVNLKITARYSILCKDISSIMRNTVEIRTCRIIITTEENKHRNFDFISRYSFLYSSKLDLLFAAIKVKQFSCWSIGITYRPIL